MTYTGTPKSEAVEVVNDAGVFVGRPYLTIVVDEAGLDAATQQLAVLDADIAEARADVAQAQADLRTAELNLGYTEIRSPIDGYIGNRAAEGLRRLAVEVRLCLADGRLLQQRASCVLYALGWD